MGVAGHEHVAILIALGDELVEEALYFCGDVDEFVAGEELEVYEHLIVAAAAWVDLLTHIAQAAGEDHLHLWVHILDTLFYHKLTTLSCQVDILQLGKQLGEFVMLQKSDGFEHGDMGHGTQYIVFCQIEIHLTVATDGETLYLLVDLKVLFPEFHAILNLLHVFYLGEGIGDFLDTILQGLLNHTLDEGVELGTYRHLHLCVLLIDG